MIERIHWLGHASFRINGSPHEEAPTIYIDPWQVPAGSPPADLILISHDHHDHYSPDDIALIRRPHTVIIANQRAAAQIGSDAQILRPWQGAINYQSVSVRATPAYTINQNYHAKSYEGIGFLITMLRHDIYYAGDTDLIPEMDKIGCDIALLPVGGSFTMNYEEAAKSVKRLRPQYAIPMHYGREIPGSKSDGHYFCQMVNSGTQAIELSIENPSFT